MKGIDHSVVKTRRSVLLFWELIGLLYIHVFCFKSRTKTLHSCGDVSITDEVGLGSEPMTFERGRIPLVQHAPVVTRSLGFLCPHSNDRLFSRFEWRLTGFLEPIFIGIPTRLSCVEIIRKYENTKIVI